MEEPRKGPLDRIDVAAPDKLCLQAAPTGSFAGYWVHNANKQMNILFEAETNGLLLGKQGSLFSPKGNLRGAGAGNLLLILEHVNVDAMLTPSVRGALLSPDGNTLSFLAESPRAPSSRAMNRTGRPQLELTRGNANAD